MVLTQRDIQARKDKILAITIQYYVETVTPVSSQYIAQHYPSSISSATIRNILAELEQNGLLTHPHTSAGRIPTQMGYRYYVDHLMHEIQILEDEKDHIKKEIAREQLALDTLLERTSEVLSETTNCTSIISIDGSDQKIFCQGTSYIVNYPEVQDVEKIGQILKAIDQKRDLLNIINRTLEKKIDVYIGQEIAHRAINSCSLVVASYKTKKGPSGRIAILGPTRMNYERVVSTLDYFSELIEEML